MASYYQRKNGTYCVRVYVCMKDGKEILVSKTYRPVPGMSASRVRKDVQKFAKAFEAMVRAGDYIPGAKFEVDEGNGWMKISEFAAKYYCPRIREKCSPNTYRFYKSVVDQIIVPSFGDLRLVEVTSSDLQDFIDFLSEKPEARTDGRGTLLAAPTVKRYATVFRSMMAEARRIRFIEDDPFPPGSVEYPQDKRLKHLGLDSDKAYGMEELQSFLLALKGEKPLNRIILLTSVVLGLRRGEVVALTWDDVNFQDHYVSVNKSAYKIKGDEQGIKSPKSMQGYRMIPMPEIYETELRSWKNLQDKMKEEAGPDWNRKGFVFAKPAGEMVSLYYPTKLCSKFEERHKLRHLKLHGLRHTFDSLLYANGLDLETIRDLMGHKSISTTEIYTHALNENKKKAAKIMNDCLKCFNEVSEE